VRELIEKVKNTSSLEKSEIVALLTDNEINEELFRAADEVRHEFVGDEVHLRALIEFSNYCRCNCKYCGLRAENVHVSRYRLSEVEILDFAHKAVDFGYKTIVMQSGEDMFFKTDYLAAIVKEIKNLDVALTLSIGERSYEDYKILKDAGADRFLLRIETTDENLYKEMHPKASFQNRKRCLYDLKKLGFETGSGCLVGLPGQTLESLADDILFFKELDADMIGIGPFIPHQDTPLKDIPHGNFTLALKVMALTRLLLPDINIPATTAMETLNPNGRLIALQSGANVVMPNVTEGDYRKKYEIYPGKICVNDTPAKCRGCIESKIKSIGRIVSDTKGFRGGDNAGKSINGPLTLNPSPVGRGKKLSRAQALRKCLTPQEYKLWQLLRGNKLNNTKFKRQYPLGKYIVDFVCIEKMLVIEIDGGGHNTDKQIKFDINRTSYLNSRGFKVIRFWNNEVDSNIDGVIEQISLALRERD